jgi:hypothetical protein
MKRGLLLLALLTMVIGSVGLLHGQKAGQQPATAPAATDVSKLTIGRMLEEMQATKLEGYSEPPSPLQVVVQFLQLRQDQVEQLGQLLQARQAAVVPLLENIQQRLRRLEELLDSGGNPAEIGVLVIQIRMLQLNVAQVQQNFLSKWVSLLDPEQSRRLEAVRLAASLQPVMPAFQQLYLF